MRNRLIRRHGHSAETRIEKPKTYVSTWEILKYSESSVTNQISLQNICRTNFLADQQTFRSSSTWSSLRHTSSFCNSICIRCTASIRVASIFSQLCCRILPTALLTCSVHRCAWSAIIGILSDGLRYVLRLSESENTCINYILLYDFVCYEKHWSSRVEKQNGVYHLPNFSNKEKFGNHRSAFPIPFC